MAESKTSVNRLNAAERQLEALELRRRGRGFQQIADELGYRGASGAYQAVMAGLKLTLQEPSDEVRSLEVERLDRLIEGIWDKAVGGDEKAIDRVLGIMERRAKYLGLDAPTKTQNENRNIHSRDDDGTRFLAIVAAARQRAGKAGTGSDPDSGDSGGLRGRRVNGPVANGHTSGVSE
jgi:hypothetical protein